MKAIIGSQLDWGDAPDPACGEHQVLIRVYAAGVNRADLMQAKGAYPPPPGVTDILGLEAAGVIEETGAKVTGWKAGDRVCTLLPGGGYAEKAAVDARMPHRLPEDWSFVHGAAFPEAWYTAFVNLFLEAQLKAGESVLIHAGASGVGTAAIQLARAAGAIPYVTVGSEEKAAFCRELGAALAINYKERDFAADLEGVDVILDCIGGAYLPRNISLLKRFGRLVNIGLLGGSKGELNMAQLLLKRLRMIGSTLRSRSVDEQAAIRHAFEERFWPDLSAGRLRLIIDRSLPMQKAAEAHRYVAENRNTGKVVLTLD
ncbi:MAG: NAD(P)H-quinone oxidoreductase [Bryobacteraceae bacterium]|nr:NAD(P)H-quinone oxidoreductase [Bryobacteraceae bacterium]